LKVWRLDKVQISNLLAELRGGWAILGSVLLEHVLVVAERKNNDHGQECEGCAE
jgi:epoxyqueuosine reductase QueG